MKMLMSAALLAGLFAVAGCGPKTAESTGGDKKVANGGVSKELDHSGWWCNEHGVPEENCSMCSSAVFKKLKPDEICPKHPDRAKAQCFICNPELWEKSKASYVAKFGTEPPEPEDNKPETK